MKPNQSQANTSKCGDGLNNTYYTRATNIDGKSGTLTTIRNDSEYKYAACRGQIGVDVNGGGVKYLPHTHSTSGLNVFSSFEIRGIHHPSGDGGAFVCTKFDH